MDKSPFFEGMTSYQVSVLHWMLACFGKEITADRRERSHRFLEEALELVQSMHCTQEEAHKLVDYVFGRPSGNPRQEVGCVMVTLAALCAANDIDLGAEADLELSRVWMNVQKIRAKHARKPKLSPLPGASDADLASTHPDITEAVEMTISFARFRMLSRVDSCLERHNGDEKAATTGVGIAINYLFGRDIVRVLEKAETEIARLRRVIERDRSRVSEIYSSIKSLMAGRRWLTIGRGSYEWNDDRYRNEFGAALYALEEAVKPLRQIAGDLTDAPVDTDQIKLARAGE